MTCHGPTPIYEHPIYEVPIYDALNEVDVLLGFIEPGKPTQNAFIEILNGKFRNECFINQHGFSNIKEARQEIDD